MQPTPLWLTLVSIALSGVVSAITTVMFNAQNAERVLRRTKLEELCNILLVMRTGFLQRELLLREGDLKEAQKLPDIDIYQLYHALTLVKLYVPGFYLRFGAEVVAMRERLVATKRLDAESSLKDMAEAFSQAGDGLDRAYLATLEASETGSRWSMLLNR
jgi:hypothetical protein